MKNASLDLELHGQPEGEAVQHCIYKAAGIVIPDLFAGLFRNGKILRKVQSVKHQRHYGVFLDYRVGEACRAKHEAGFASGAPNVHFVFSLIIVLILSTLRVFLTSLLDGIISHIYCRHKPRVTPPVSRRDLPVNDGIHIIYLILCRREPRRRSER